MTPRIRIVVQCRVSSSRLPAKALLPLAGFPSALLCIRRAANTGLDVRAAISTHPTDDVLAKLLTQERVPLIRGPLDDVRARFLMAISDLADMDRVVRLTADNVFPDGSFVEELVADAVARSLDYSSTSSPFDGLPYGLSAETFTAGALRRAAAQGGDSFDREHVTPALRRPSPPAPFRPSGLTSNYGHLRCTLDSFEDYDRLLRVFESVRDPIRISWRELCDRLAALDDAPRFRIPFRHCGGRVCGVMALGTAQLGLDQYGAANTTGRPARATAVAMVRDAVRHGVTEIDCARAYGTAESVVGEAINHLPRDSVRVITKLDPLSDLPLDAPPAMVGAAVEASVFRSCRELRTQRLDVLLLHRWTHRTSHGGEVWAALKRLQAEGCIDTLGASVYTPAEAMEALDDPDVRHIQLPFNLLDRRWHAAGVPERAQSRPEVTVHARSILLQGLLVGPPEAWPKLAGVDALEWIHRLECAASEVGRASRADLCFAYVAAQPWINAAVVGAETPDQLSENLERCRKPPLTEAECRQVEALLDGAPERLLNPTLWKAGSA